MIANCVFYFPSAYRKTSETSVSPAPKDWEVGMGQSIEDVVNRRYLFSDMPHSMMSYLCDVEEATFEKTSIQVKL